MRQEPKKDSTSGPDLDRLKFNGTSRGAIEMVGGLLAGSQALKADALDFLGDGLITFLGIVALTWRPDVRARVALTQGLFLGALGLGVLGTTAFRVLSHGNRKPT